jgi:hypothetical protein
MASLVSGKVVDALSTVRWLKAYAGVMPPPQICNQRAEPVLMPMQIQINGRAPMNLPPAEHKARCRTSTQSRSVLNRCSENEQRGVRASVTTATAARIDDVSEWVRPGDALRETPVSDRSECQLSWFNTS